MRLALAITVGLLLALPATAAAQADIEGVWGFTGGQVAVQPQSDGSFLGTVVRQTQFAECPHPVGEKMWTGVRPQGDGQYWGFHQWFNTADCSYKSPLGKIALRVLAKPDGSRFLRVCFARPENQDTQPTIAPDGTATGDEQGCNDSDLLAPLPKGTPAVNTIATLPSQGRKRCLSKRSFRIRLKEPRGDALVSANVFVNGRRVATRSGARITAPVNLRGLPRGRYSVRITARTVLGRTITGTRRYRTCAPKRRRG
jgi:hypothetical protein